MKSSSGHDFEKLAPYYDQALKILLFPFGGERKLRKAVVSFISTECLWPQAKILEIGSGTASNLLAIDQAFPGKFELLGVDSSRAMIDYAKKKKFASRVAFFNADASSLPLESQTVDLALLVFTLHELEKEKRIEALKEVLRVLKKQGLLLLVDFSFPQSKIGKILFFLLQLIENDEALSFARKSLPQLIENFPFKLKKERFLLSGLVRMVLYQKS